MNIYHYTSMKALFGILKNREFWWGNTASMNDRREMVEFTAKISSVVKNDFGEIFPERVSEFNKHIEEEMHKEPFFAMCFSAQEEDASQWERYADNATGVCFKINSEVFLQMLEGCKYFFNDVYYNFDIRNHSYYPAIEQYMRTGDGIDELISCIIASSPSYKNRSFWSECEKRAYTMYAKNFAPDKNAFSLEFECKNNIIRPILKIKYDVLCETKNISVDDLFEEIIIGPRSEQTVGELKLFCKSMGFDSLAENIKLSTCPLR